MRPGRVGLTRRVGRHLPVSLLYDHPTLNGIARLLAGAARPPVAEPRPAAPPPTAPIADSEFDYLDTLTAAELADLIEREMDES